jgi:hypothetical protein
LSWWCFLKQTPFWHFDAIRQGAVHPIFVILLVVFVSLLLDG